MAKRVKCLERLTAELLINISSWEKVHGPFLFEVSGILLSFFDYYNCIEICWQGERYVDRVNSQEENYLEVMIRMMNMLGW